VTRDKANWEIVGESLVDDDRGPLFFTDHEWATVEAAAARIIPTDHDPGAREAGCVRYIDRYLSGTRYIYAAADGSGFLQLAGKEAEAWRARIARMQRTYRAGVHELDRLASARQRNARFRDLGDDHQDQILAEISGRPKPDPIAFEGEGEERAGAFQMGAFDEGLGFFDALVLHVRQGFYCDPVYGGNRDRIGWKVIGFPGPASLKDTMDGTYSLRDQFLHDLRWADLIPHLRERVAPINHHYREEAR
jgi:gluconate 2-dehydrogenase gamma chain